MINSGKMVEGGQVVEYNQRKTGVLKSPGGLHLSLVKSARSMRQSEVVLRLSGSFHNFDTWLTPR